MKRFNFTGREIDSHWSGLQEWHSFVRRREAEMIFSMFPHTRFPLALELGAGDGGQSLTISRYCDRLICTEKDPTSHEWLGGRILEREVANVEYRLCDAEDLSQFESGTFDLVFSSNMLEHIENLNRCLAECRRVLKPGGLMLHTMPSRWWKASSTLLAPFKFQVPRVHGVSSNHLSEFWRFGRHNWEHTIEKGRFRVEAIIGLPFYHGHGIFFRSLVKAGNTMRAPASFLYIVRRPS